MEPGRFARTLAIKGDAFLAVEGDGWVVSLADDMGEFFLAEKINAAAIG